MNIEIRIIVAKILLVILLSITGRIMYLTRNTNSFYVFIGSLMAGTGYAMILWTLIFGDIIPSDIPLEELKEVNNYMQTFSDLNLEVNKTPEELRIEEAKENREEIKKYCLYIFFVAVFAYGIRFLV
jgi:hypothetical protein